MACDNLSPAAQDLLAMPVVQTNLVSDGFVEANHIDPSLVNPWGVSHSPTSPFWVSNAGTGTTTLYNGDGQPLAAAGNFAYTTNAGSGSIGRFAVARDGSLSLVGTTTLGAGSHPLDEAVSRDQDLLYVLVDGSHQIAGYRVGHDGSLTPVTSVTVPTGVAGLAAR